MVGKDLFPAPAKSSVLQIIDEQKTIPCAILHSPDDTISDTVAYAIKILKIHGETLGKRLNETLNMMHRPDQLVSEVFKEQQDLEEKIRSINFAIDKLKEQD